MEDDEWEDASNDGEESVVSELQEIDFCTMGMFIIGKRCVFSYKCKLRKERSNSHGSHEFCCFLSHYMSTSHTRNCYSKHLKHSITEADLTAFRFGKAVKTILEIDFAKKRRGM